MNITYREIHRSRSYSNAVESLKLRDGIIFGVITCHGAFNADGSCSGVKYVTWVPCNKFDWEMKRAAGHFPRQIRSDKA